MEAIEADLNAKFDEHCKKYLDLDNVVSHIDGTKGILVDFDYFLIVVKSVFFW